MDRGSRVGGAALVFLAGVIFFGLFNAGLALTNKTEFCTSCHSMKWNLEEWQDSAHFMNHAGVRIGCANCHVPKQFFPKMKAKILAAKDVWHEILGTIDTKEKFEKHRWKMANRVWAKLKATDSRECRNCHSWEAMATDEQDKIARKKHSRARDEGKTCIDCHKGVAHEMPDEPEEEEESKEG
jgi:cytochrome c-type protein NapC